MPGEHTRPPQSVFEAVGRSLHTLREVAAVAIGGFKTGLEELADPQRREVHLPLSSLIRTEKQ